MLKLFEHPFLGRGFRPFFLCGAVYTVFSVLLWGGFYAGHTQLPEVLGDPVGWHAHEMIYGFTMAIVAGFLLTAVANWTGGAPARQLHLAGLVALWGAGRLVLNLNTELPSWLVYGIAGAFIPALAVSLALPLLKSRNIRNFIFLGLLSILSGCEAAYFITGKIMPLYLAVLMIVIMVSLIGGRIIPAFTVAALRRRGETAYPTPQPKADIAALLSLIILGVVLVVFGNADVVFAAAAFIAAIIHAWRMRYYLTARVWHDPMLWILHLGYAWLVVGLFCAAAAGLEIIPFSTALHSITVGSIGSMTLGMMCRVTLGHTGRDLAASKLTTLAFILMQLAAVIRVGGVIVMPTQATLWIAATACLWAGCFAFYLPVYAPMLWKQRPDGAPA
ncbi:MAG: NnrS family protein [Alphaproteobacteria bacterium]|nr:MAG: NnrS family protein [Alphaproteobacteria bacterium]